MIISDADDSIVCVFVCFFFVFFLCLLAQLLLRSQLCNLIMYDKISIIVFAIQYLYFESCIYMYTYTCTSCIVKIRLTSLMFGQGWPPYKALPMVQGAGVTSWGLGCGISNNILSTEQIHTVRCEKKSSACPWL